jgi:hypothetical protein
MVILVYENKTETVMLQITEVCKNRLTTSVYTNLNTRFALAYWNNFNLHVVEIKCMHKTKTTVFIIYSDSRQILHNIPYIL